ncbi:hypothetical protein RYH80_06780 [Halobaculum sp. MBLA0147]|uniref:hypothetical protein n=1 Tax=Halobaculum sp. MBLA0147 TaxID=3079934 RepID=UPI0035265077
MSRAPERPGDTDTGAAARDFFAAQTLLSTPRLAFLYTDLLVHSPTTVTAARERTGTERSTAYKYANRLAELGVARETDDRVDGAALWRTEPVVGTWQGVETFGVSPTLIAVYGASTRDDDLELFRDRHGTSAGRHRDTRVPPWRANTARRRGGTRRPGDGGSRRLAGGRGDRRRRRGADPTVDTDTLPVEIHERVVADCPYTPRDDG